MFKMASSLISYHNFIDVLTKDNQTLLSNVTNKFESQMYTEKQVGSWQSVPNIEIKTGDSSSKNKPLSTSNQDRVGMEGRTVLFNHSKQQTWVSFTNQPVIQNEINIPITVSDSSQNQWQMPTPINLDSSGLHCSSRPEVLNRHGKVYSNRTPFINQNAHILHLTSPQTNTCAWHAH
jgi:hypothetical protein